MSVNDGQTTAEVSQPVEASTEQAAQTNQQQTGQQQPVQTDGSDALSNWRDTLPDELKMDASLLKFNDIPSLAKSYVNAQRLIGADKIALPGEHATDDEWSEVYDRLGRPKMQKTMI